MNANDSLCAWKTVSEAGTVFSKINAINKRAPLPLSVVKPLVDDLRHKNEHNPTKLGELKHSDYLRDIMNSVEFPARNRGYIIGRMMACALTEFDGKKPDYILAIKLYEEFTVEDGAGYNSKIPFIAHISAIKAYSLKGDMKSAQLIFNKVIDESFDEELDAFIELIKGYSLNKDRSSTLSIYEKMKNEGLKPSVSVYESVLSVAPEMSEELRDVIIDAGIIACPKLHPNVYKCLGGEAIPKLLIK